MRTTILFLTMMTMIFVISPCTTHAQEDQCFPGLEQIPPVADSDASTTSNFVGQGGQIYGVQITAQQNGQALGVNIIRGTGSTGSVNIVLYSDENDSPGVCLTEISPTNFTLPGVAGFPNIDTTAVLFNTSVEITASQKVWVGVKFSGTSSRHLRQFPDAEGLRFSFGNPWNNPFPEDLSLFPAAASNVEPGLYGIYLIMENCEDPPVPVEGCTDENAFNFNPDATIDDGSCIFPILGCTNEEAFNFNPDAELDDGSCVLEVDCVSAPDCFRADVNIDGTINVFDVLVFLSAFGVDTQSLIDASWCNGIQLDMNNNGVLDASDLSIMLTCFGLTLDWEAYYQSLGE